MKQLIKHLFTTLGFKIQRVNKKGNDLSVDFKNPFEVQDYLINSTNDKEVIIFDVGALDGRSALRYLKHMESSKIYSFEPFPDSFSKLVANTTELKNIVPINKGLGSKKGLASFNSNSSPRTNSLMKTHESGSQIWGKGLLETQEVIEVELTTVDAIVKEYKIPGINILKMDVQGAEVKVLEGARDTLGKGMVDLIYTEIITLPTYEGQLVFEETIKVIKSYGFKLFSLYDLSLTSQGELRQLDAIFIKSDLDH